MLVILLPVSDTFSTFRQELLAREIEEMRECTFQPAVNSSYIRPSGYSEHGQPVIVRGLSRHMELQHLTAKKKVQLVTVCVR